MPLCLMSWCLAFANANVLGDLTLGFALLTQAIEQLPAALGQVQPGKAQGQGTASHQQGDPEHT